MPAVVLAQGVIQAMIVTKLKTVVVLLAALCLLGSGAGLLSWEVAAKADPGTLAAPAPMKIEVPEPNPNPANAQEQRSRSDLAEHLKLAINHAGIDVDPKTTLQDALEQMQKRYAIEIHVNAKAFADEKVEHVLNYPIVEHTALPAMNDVRLGTALKVILRRVPVKSGSALIVRNDMIEITTQAALRAEFGAKGRNRCRLWCAPSSTSGRWARP